MELKSIPASELKEGMWFKTSEKKRICRYVHKVIRWKEGDTEMLKGKTLLILEGCRQLVLENDLHVLAI